MTDLEQAENKLFVYGIFLSEQTRQRFGMTNPRYDTVLDYVTMGDHIVQAVHVPLYTGEKLSLTGLVVDIDPNYWGKLDALEGGYDRVVIRTTAGECAFMYVSPIDNQLTNYSTKGVIVS